SYASRVTGIGPDTGQHLPLIVQQIGHNLRLMLTIEKQLLLVLLIGSWGAVRSRLFVVALVVAEMVLLLTRFYGRTELAIVLLTAIVLWHRLVRPLSLKVVVLAGVLILAGLVAYGFVRDLVVSRESWGTSHQEAQMAPGPDLVTQNNEFQVLF